MCVVLVVRFVVGSLVVEVVVVCVVVVVRVVVVVVGGGIPSSLQLNCKQTGRAGS